MRLRERLDRLEKRVIPGDPFADLTDDELDAAIVAIKANIEAGTGMSEPELADRFEKDLASESRTFELDEKLMRGFVDQVKREYRLNA